MSDHFVIPWTIARQAPLSVGFSRQEYQSGVSFPSPGDLPHPEIEPGSLASPALAGRFFTTLPPGKPNKSTTLQFLKFLIKEREVRREWILTVTVGTVVRETPI